MKKIMLVFGTRPEAIKMAPLVKEFQKNSHLIKTIVCVTGQHRELLDSVLKIFEIVPDYDLNIMKNNQDLFDITSSVLLGMREVFKQSKPDFVLVHGDTATSTAVALAAFYYKIKIGHIEAGLRTNDLLSPWPEEANRQITTRLANFHFAPTLLNQQNLLQENVPSDRIIVTGNTVIDALKWSLEKYNQDNYLQNNVNKTFINSRLDELLLRKNKIVLITGHRRENFGIGFIHICEAIKELGYRYPGVNFIYPMHLNPNVRSAIKEVFKDKSYITSNIFFIEPLDYMPFIKLFEYSTVILTDSGGIQEEAPFLGKPVIVMRDTTERPEAISSGIVKLVGSDHKKIVDGIANILDNGVDNNVIAEARNIYGDGQSSKRIVDYFLNNNTEL